MAKIRIAIVGVGNCASSLVQGIAYYKEKRDRDAIGLMHWDIGGYKPYDPYDVKVVAAFDIDKRKVGVLYSPSAYFMKHPAKQFSDDEGFRMTEEFIAGRRED